MNKELLNIHNIRECVFQGKIYWTQHCLNRLNKRNIKLVDVKKAIYNGKIIENYYDDYLYPSCLILGKSKNKLLHTVFGMNNNIVYIITAYYPDSNEWEEDMKTRRRE